MKTSNNFVPDYAFHHCEVKKTTIFRDLSSMVGQPGWISGYCFSLTRFRLQIWNTRVFRRRKERIRAGRWSRPGHWWYGQALAERISFIYHILSPIFPYLFLHLLSTLPFLVIHLLDHRRCAGWPPNHLVLQVWKIGLRSSC